ncbi:MAG: molybdate ABC transporter permease [Acidimicrobiia bacterium]
MSGLTTQELQIVALSLKVAVAAITISIPPAIAVAWLLSRTRFPGKWLLNALVHLPLVLPPVVTGYALLRVFGRQGVLGAWLADTVGVTLVFQWTGAAVAAAVMGFPLMVRGMRLALDAVDPALEDAAATLGASPVRTFFTVSLPLALPGVFAGIILGFAKALGEFGATITFVSNIPGETRTLALAIFTLLDTPDGDAAVLRLVWISIAVSMSAVLASEWLARRATPHHARSRA